MKLYLSSTYIDLDMYGIRCYAGALLLLWASVMGHWTWANGFLALIVSGAVAVRIWDEERELRQHFRGYEEYSRRTKRLVPGLF